MYLWVDYIPYHSYVTSAFSKAYEAAQQSFATFPVKLLNIILGYESDNKFLEKELNDSKSCCRPTLSLILSDNHNHALKSNEISTDDLELNLDMSNGKEYGFNVLFEDYAIHETDKYEVCKTDDMNQTKEFHSEGFSNFIYDVQRRSSQSHKQP